MDDYKSINFETFKKNYPILAEFCIIAEKYIHQDPTTSLMKIRQFGELLAKEVAASIDLYNNPREFQYNLLVNLEKKGIIRPNISNLFHQIRIAGNKANHEISDINPVEQYEKNYKLALKQLKNSHKLSLWYLNLNKKYTQDIPNFIEPSKPTLVSKQASAIELKKLDDNYQTLLSEIQKIQEQPKDIDQINKTILIAQNKAEEITLESGEFEVQSSNINLLPIDTILNNQYKIIEILSAGNFGQTYLANDTNSFDEKVVVKQFRPQLSDEGTINSAKILFKKEAQTLYKLNKIEGIPNLKAFFEENNQFYLVQEFINGNTLEEEILIGNKFNESEIIKLLQDILTPLNNLHSLSVIHRDIKPSNLVRNVNDKKIYLIDFGAVKEIVNNSTDGTIIIGTKGYMPFEQLQGQPQLNSDIYAVGIIAIQAATGLKISKINEGQWQVEANHLSNNLISILEKMTAISYKNRYSYVQEILDALKTQKSTNINSEPITSAVVSPNTPGVSPSIADVLDKAVRFHTRDHSSSSGEMLYALEPPTQMQPNTHPLQPVTPIPTASPSSTLKNPQILVIASIVSLVVLGIAMRSLPYLWKPKVQAKALTIGTLSAAKYNGELVDYLQKQLIPSNFIEFFLGKKVNLTLNGDENLPYQEAKNRLAKKQWDIAFTLSPIISVAAKDNGYRFAALMFPEKPPYYQSALYVRADSPIQSLNDITPNTVIALGGFNSASSFYMPVYDLYGKTLTVEMGHRGQEIRKMVRTRKADLGAGALGDTVKNDADIRIIHLSRDIPGSGVYISPELSESDRNTIQKVLLNAPKDLQKQANYGAGSEPNYTAFIEIIQRTEEVLGCSDFRKNPVSFFCATASGTVPTRAINPETAVRGRVNGWKRPNADTVWLTLIGQDNQVFRVVVSPQILNQVPGAANVLELQNKEIKVMGVIPNNVGDGMLELNIKDSRELEVL